MRAKQESAGKSVHGSADFSSGVTYSNSRTISACTFSDLKVEQRAEARRGAQLLVAALCAEGVNTVFGYPGGANLEIFDVLEEFGLRCIRTEHEQGAIHAAQGYARATGRLGVCLATSGPGATNLVTGLADANSDSTPILAITGNVPTHLLGRNSFQEVDIVAITRPITKRSIQVTRVAAIPEVVREACALAAGGRPGPVLIDIPKDIQQMYPVDSRGNYWAPPLPAAIDPPPNPPKGLRHDQLALCQELMQAAERPVIYAGGGVVHAGAEAALLQLAEKLQAPVATTLMGQGIFPPDHPLALHCLGMHGSKYAKVAINEADLVLALGVRFDDRVTGDVQQFIAEGKIIHIDIDSSELNKNKCVTLPLAADLCQALSQLAALSLAPRSARWLDYIRELRAAYPLGVPGRDQLAPQAVIARLCEYTDGEALVTTGVGQHQMWAMQHYRSRRSRSFISSSGFGTMGFGLPAAIGAKVAEPQRTVIDIDGDGSLNMAISELAACRRYRIGVKVVVINNQWLGMVRQWQDMIYDSHRAESDLCDPNPEGGLGVYPDFVSIARGYGVAAERVENTQQLDAALERMLAEPQQPYLLDVVVAREENVFPMIPAGASYRDIIMDDRDLANLQAASQGSNI